MECFLTLMIMRWRLTFFTFIPFCAACQFFLTPTFGWKAGAIFQFGTHANNFGIQVNTFVSGRFCQLNIGEQVTFRLSDLGRRRLFFQSRFSSGIVLLSGKELSLNDFQLNGLLHNTTKNYGLSYNYIWYLDNKGSSQNSGGWGVHVKNFTLLFENDFFGGQGKDRFRTGHFAFSYRQNSWKINAGFSIWTGESSGSHWTKIRYKGCPNGFRILEDTPFGTTSHGIAYVGFDYMLDTYEWLGCKIGIDSEKLRHQLQNRLMHDLVWLPKGIKRNTPHYPMLDKNGCPVFDLNKSKPAQFFFNGGLNNNWSY
jgi:hypothetical protein